MGTFPANPKTRCVTLLIAVVFVITLSVRPQPACAQPLNDRFSSIVIDARTGQVLSAISADQERYPASLTKLMTLYMLFEALRDHRVTLDEIVPVSPHAASMEPSKLGLVPGTRLTVQQAVLGLVTKSANDAASALGELLGGDEARFGDMMTLRARALGMSHTTFRNASGLPDPQQMTTARDLAVLARHLVEDFPEDYGYFSVPSFVFHGRTIFNHDRMLVEYPGADGMKTGYTRAAGHNLVTSALHGDIRLIGVVLGAESLGARDQEMAGLLNAGFTEEGAPSAGTLLARSRFGRLPLLVARLLVPRAEAATVPRRRLAASTSSSGWGVQVSAFSSMRAAERTAWNLHRAMAAGVLHVTRSGTRGHTGWKVDLLNVSERQAELACSAAVRLHRSCQTIRPVQQFASR